jgi:hypothetical protein
MMNYAIELYNYILIRNIIQGVQKVSKTVRFTYVNNITTLDFFKVEFHTNKPYV